MLTFKQFLNTQSDDIEDMEAVRKYQEYKLEFRKTQIADFFTSHKEEEWYVYIEMRFCPGECFIVPTCIQLYNPIVDFDWISNGIFYDNIQLFS